MESLFILIPLSVLAVAVAAWVFLRMSDSGQFDDMDSPAWSVLHDSDEPAEDPINHDEPETLEGEAAQAGERDDRIAADATQDKSTSS